MLTRWGDIDSVFTWMDELRRRMDQAFREFDTSYGLLSGTAWPRANLYDTGAEFVLKAEMPGLSAKDVNLSITQDTLTVSGERKLEVPEGYSTHRKERVPLSFSRSFSLPCRIDAEKVSANLQDGLLTVRLSKAAEAQPRQIAVKAH